MTNVLIIDDDAKCRKALKDGLTAVSTSVRILAECASAEEAKKAIDQLKPDVIFLDVEMPGKNGFDLLNEIGEASFDIIFTTAYERYAIQAIKASALDFLLKPVTEQDIQEALQRFEEKKQKTNVLRQVSVLLENYGINADAHKTIVVPTRTGLEFIHTNQIIRLEADNTYTTFFLTGNTKLLVAKTLKEMEELLPAGLFYRVHHSHVINIDFVKRFQKSDGGALIMEDRSEVPVSRQRKEDLLAFLKKK